MARTVEDRLTLACLKLLFKEREEVMKEIGALVGMGVNEHAFLHGLEREGVAGLVYFTLSQDSSAKTLFADGIVAKLREGYYSAASRNVRTLHHLAMVLQHFERAGIKTVVWKGAALVDEVYPSPGTRGMSDVDLVVPETQFARATQLLTELDFSSSIAHPYLFFAPGL
ncbi:MAG: nucleotidyltransferase family protein, partial [Nitrospira sp.]|nr:nucleotidyltransferase family protein [Nitrospira sp.]